jgi:hypothetical protein
VDSEQEGARCAHNRQRRNAMKIQTANQVNGKATGVFFCAGFGALWLVLALIARLQLGVATVCGVGLGLAALLAAAVYLRRLAKRWPHVPDDPGVGRAFAWINAIEWVAVGAAAFTLSKLHLDAYVMSAITAIVGLHMFPLGRIFHYPAHYRAGTIMMAWAVASAVFIPVEEMQGITALGTGALLWFSAVVTLVVAIPAARQSARLQAIAKPE